MHTFRRPDKPFVHAERRPVVGRCDQCDGEEIATYRVLTDGGYWNVVKCQTCLASLQREPGPPFGSFTPLSASL